MTELPFLQELGDKLVRAGQQEIQRRRRKRVGIVTGIVAAIGVAALLLTMPDPSEIPTAADLSVTRPVNTSAEPQHESETTLSPLPPRYGHVLVVTESNILVWGGRDLENEPLSDGSIYDTVTGTWESIATGPLSGAWHAAFQLNGIVYVYGASGFASYDPLSDSWQALPTGPIEVADELGFSVAADGGSLFIWSFETNEMAMFDTASSIWRPLAGPIEDAVSGKLHAEDGRVLAVAATMRGSGFGSAATLVVAELEQEAGWRQFPERSFDTGEVGYSAVANHSAMLGGVLVVWGESGESSGPAFALDVSGVWQELPPPPLPETLLALSPIVMGEDSLLATSDGGPAALLNLAQGEWEMIVEVDVPVLPGSSVNLQGTLFVYDGDGTMWTWPAER